MCVWPLVFAYLAATQATSYALRCLRMGAPWCFWDTWTESLRFLYTSTGFTQYYEEAWTQFQSWQDEQCGMIDVARSIARALETWGVDNFFFNVQHPESQIISLRVRTHYRDSE